MRTEVKVAAVASLVIVVVAGWYYLGRGTGEQSVQLAQATAPPPAKPGTPATKPPVHRPTAPAKQPARTLPAAPTKPPVADSTTPPGGSPGVFDIGQASASDKPPTTLAELLRSGTDTAEKDDPSPGAPSSGAARGANVRGAATAQPATDTRTAMTPTQPGMQPAAASNAAKPALDGPGVRRHTVERGDTLSVLAEIYYGSQKHVNVLLAANPQVKDPGTLLIGTVLAIPPLPTASPATARVASPAPAVSGAGTYMVKEGDSFYGIAREVLGSSSRWRELYELNKATVGDDPGSLRVGHVLKLPDGKAVASN